MWRRARPLLLFCAPLLPGHLNFLGAFLNLFLAPARRETAWQRGPRLEAGVANTKVS